MNEERVWFDLLNVIRQTFDDDSLAITRTTTAADIDVWDSLSNVELLVALEGAFDIRFRTGEMATIKTVGELADVIAERVHRDP